MGSHEIQEAKDSIANNEYEERKKEKITTQITCTLDKENTFILLSFFRIQASQPAQNGAKRAKKKNTLVKKQNKGPQI